VTAKELGCRDEVDMAMDIGRGVPMSLISCNVFRTQAVPVRARQRIASVSYGS
jgi:hypothetical protein